MPPESHNFRPEMVPQPHGGAIVNGAHSGPHPGRPPSAVRAALREAGYNRLHILEEIADNPEIAARDHINAIALMLEHGMRGNVTIDDVRFAVSRTLEVIQEVALLKREWQIAEVIGGTTESWVFPAPKEESEPIGRDTLNKWWQRFAHAAELPKRQGYGWHSCGRGFANRLHRAGAALKDLQGLGGWKTSATLVEVYLQADEDAQRRALALDDSP